MAVQRRISAEQQTIPSKDILIAIANDIATGNKCEMVQLLGTGALAINGAANPAAKIGNVIYGMAVNVAGQVVLVTKAANTAMATLVGTVLNAQFNVFCFFMDSAGVLTSAMGTAGATLGAVVFPPFPDNKICIGFIIINPTGAGSFVGGTTALDDAGVIPNTVYVNTVGGLKPTIVPTIIP
jgi:hypothetical protein